MRWMAILMLGTLLAAGDAPLFTDQEWSAAQPQSQPQAAQAPGWGAIASLGGGLLLVVAVAVALGWAAKRLNARRLLGGRGRVMELVETIQLGPRRQLALVSINGQWLVVGLGEKELSCIATMPAASPAAAVPAPPAPPSPFAAELARLVPTPAEPRP